MNQFITPLSIQSFCSFISSIVGIFFNAAHLVGVLLTPLAGLSDVVLPSSTQFVSDICFVIVAQATGAAGS